MNILKLISIANENFHIPTVKKSKHFTFVMLRKRLYTWGWNQRRQMDKEDNNFTLHSEIHALRRIYTYLRNNDLDMSKFILVNVRVNRKGEICESTPCNACLRTLIDNKIKRVIYFNSTENSWINANIQSEKFQYETIFK